MTQRTITGTNTYSPALRTMEQEKWCQINAEMLPKESWCLKLQAQVPIKHQVSLDILKVTSMPRWELELRIHQEALQEWTWIEQQILPMAWNDHKLEMASDIEEGATTQCIIQSQLLQLKVKRCQTTWTCGTEGVDQARWHRIKNVEIESWSKMCINL